MPITIVIAILVAASGFVWFLWYAPVGTFEIDKSFKFCSNNDFSQTVKY